MSPDPPHPNNFGCHSNGDTNLNLPIKLLIKWKTPLKIGFWNISVFHIPTAPKSRTPSLSFESFASCFQEKWIDGGFISEFWRFWRIYLWF